MIINMSVSWLRVCRSRPGSWYPVIKILERKMSGLGKNVDCGVLHFGSHSLRNRASYALDDLQEITYTEWYQLLAPMITGSAQNRLRNLSHSTNAAAMMVA